MLSVPITSMPNGTARIHATTIAFKDKALLIAGPSGAGKSALGMRMLALGADLVADDVTEIAKTLAHITVHAPSTLPPLIEVRGLGLLNVPIMTGCALFGVLDLGTDEVERLPQRRHIPLLGQDVPLFYKPDTPYIAEAMLHLMMYGRAE